MRPPRRVQSRLGDARALPVMTSSVRRGPYLNVLSQLRGTSCSTVTRLAGSISCTLLLLIKRSFVETRGRLYGSIIIASAISSWESSRLTQLRSWKATCARDLSSFAIPIKYRSMEQSMLSGRQSTATRMLASSQHRAVAKRNPTKRNLVELDKKA